MIGETISHYHILSKLGQGGMGVVYKAEDTKLKRTVALKFLPPEFTRDQEAKKRFIHEAQAAAALEHPNICNIHEVMETPDGHMFIVMAFYEGETLKESISDGPMPVKGAIEVILQIAGGLEKAHQKEIVHRDIKSANIIMTRDGVPKILDFGLAKLRGRTKLTVEGTTMGTVAYMSPEQTTGERVDRRTDIWSLGVVLYELLSCELPFKGHYEQAVMYSILNEEPEFVSTLNQDVPPQLEKIVQKALHKDPEKRFQNLEEMCAALRQVLEVPRMKSSMPLSVFKLGRRRRRLLVRAIPLIVVLLAAALYLWFPRKAVSQSVSIAILPLTSIGESVGQDWFSDGMTDALITNLAKIRQLRVTSRTSVMRYKGTTKTSGEIARELNVLYLIEGSVLKMGDQVKISTRLIDTTRDEYLWAQDYEREVRNILSLQGDVARAIADEIEVNLTPREETILTGQGEVDPAAYEAYLKGNFYWNKLTEEALDTALKYYEISAELDPEYAPAYAGIALVWGARAQMGYIPFHLAREMYTPAAAKALEIDDTLAEVRYMKAAMATWYEWEFAVADEGFKSVIEQNPNMAEARAYYSHLLFMLDRPEEAMRQIERAMELDPFNKLFKTLYAMDLMYARRFDEVIDSMEAVLATSPEEPIALSTLRSAYHQEKMYDDALRIWRMSFEAKGDGEAVEALNRGESEGGYSVALQRVAELMIDRQNNGSPARPWQIATLYVRAGMADEALAWFEKAYEDHDANMPYLKIDPIFDHLRDDPRFKTLLEKVFR